MSTIDFEQLGPADPNWQDGVKKLERSSLAQLNCIGPTELLAFVPLFALFCSSSTPGSAILPAHDAARRLRDDGITVISGFQSPIEKDCLDILLRGDQPIILCPARDIKHMQVPKIWRSEIDRGRMLLVSPFTSGERRVIAPLAEKRNIFVAAMADEIIVAHAAPGGKLERLVSQARSWGTPVKVLV